MRLMVTKVEKFSKSAFEENESLTFLLRKEMAITKQGKFVSIEFEKNINLEFWP